jgi:hypothetical protein
MREAMPQKSLQRQNRPDVDGYFFADLPMRLNERIKMIEHVLALHARARKVRGAQIKALASEFKVCDQCLSISRQSFGLCTVCGAYRWRLESAEVVRVAEIIAGHPFPQTCGVVPRFASWLICLSEKMN